MTRFFKVIQLSPFNIALASGLLGVVIGYYTKGSKSDELPCKFQLPYNATFISLANSKLADRSYRNFIDRKVSLVFENSRRKVRCRMHSRYAMVVRSSDPLILKISPLDAAGIYRSFRANRSLPVIASVVSFAKATEIPICGSDSRVQYEAN